MTTLPKTWPRTTGTKHDQGVLNLILRNKLGLRKPDCSSVMTLLSRRPTLVVVILPRQQKTPASSVFQISSRRVTRRARSCFRFRDLFSFKLDEGKQRAALSMGTRQSKLDRLSQNTNVFSAGEIESSIDYIQFNCIYIYKDRHRFKRKRYLLH